MRHLRYVVQWAVLAAITVFGSTPLPAQLVGGGRSDDEMPSAVATDDLPLDANLASWPVEAPAEEQDTATGVTITEWIPQDLLDPAFERYLDIAALADAVNTLASARLTDIGLQLAEGERILGRPHKTVTSSRILALAYRLASDAKDEETISRLKNAVAALGDQKLAEAIASAERLAGDSRTAIPDLTVPISVPLEHFTMLKAYLDALRKAKVLRDQDGLKDLEDALNLETNLPAEQRQQLISLAIESRTALAKEPEESDSLLLGLAKASRAVNIQMSVSGPDAAMNSPTIWNSMDDRTCPYCNGSGESLPLPTLEGDSRSFSDDAADASHENLEILNGSSRQLGMGGVRQLGRDLDRTVNPVRGDSDVRQLGRDFDRERLNATAPGFRAGRDYTKIHIRNDTAHTIAVAIMMVEFQVNRGESRLSYYDPDPDAPWSKKYWILLAPGQTAYVGNTNVTTFYYYAVRSGGGAEWRGSDVVRVLQNAGKPMTVGFRRVGFIRSSSSPNYMLCVR